MLAGARRNFPRDGGAREIELIGFQVYWTGYAEAWVDAFMW
ncbi:hypothetical protein L286_04375 [Sphingobium sp. HDIP04]|nr:hypothetical protein L286_04375 [Sphingobium sp. HDIP04]